MRTLCLLLLLHSSLQLQCDKREIRAYTGDEFMIVCKYDHARFLFSKKYLCRGESKNTCKILRDTDDVAKTQSTNRVSIIDRHRAGFIVKVTNLQTEDSDFYWIGIDKIYADIMILVKVIVTEVPVSKPSVWPLTPLLDGPTCWGKPVTIRCGAPKGSGVFYAWYQQMHHKRLLLHSSTDITFHCGVVTEDSEFYCSANNSISSEQSDIVSVQVLIPASSNCIYAVNIQGQPIYDCKGRISTTVSETSPTMTYIEPTKTTFGTSEQFLQVNQTTTPAFFHRTWSGVPLWYEMLRWGSFTVLLISLCIVTSCTQNGHRQYDM
ncbi:uncharacterized protein LOC119785044 [Cyprinodon tularosa]|uniref:uncharacterized protein LOC119785044 n=1 Tax=Cyprinodon tularosa TaxID=77115 RepID=UPI0018E209BD|nr:uncharacterized protein LOC119785044 [Cyprinodon tularosa]